jgi:hypothetical protein
MFFIAALASFFLDEKERKNQESLMLPHTRPSLAR